MPKYDYIASLASYGEFRGDSFQRMVERRREVWFGEDGSGLIRSQRMRSTFFTEQQTRSWETNGHETRRDSCAPALDVFATGEFFGPCRRLENLVAEANLLADELDRQRSLNLHGIHQLIGEGLAPAALRATLFELAAALPGAQIIQGAQDELKRPGVSIAREENRHQEELIFDPDTLELLGYRQVLLDPDAGYAPVGATVGYSSYLTRAVVCGLPDGITLPPSST